MHAISLVHRQIYRFVLTMVFGYQTIVEVHPPVGVGCLLEVF
jgi:hypothetical protein